MQPPSFSNLKPKKSNHARTKSICNSNCYRRAFRNGVMPATQFSKLACEIALEKTKKADVKQFAGWELMEAETVINVLKDFGTTAAPISTDAQAFL